MARYARYFCALLLLGTLLISVQAAAARDEREEDDEESRAVSCRQINYTNQQEWIMFVTNDVELNEYDEIIFRTATVSGNPAGAEMWLEVNQVEVGRAPMPGEIRWSPSESGVYFVGWRTNADFGYFYRHESLCMPGSPGSTSGDGGNSGPVIGSPCRNVFDSRINNSLAYDCAAPVAVYTGSIDVYGIHPQTGEGLLLLRIEDELLSGDAPVENTLLGEATNPMTNQPVRVYRLTSDEIYLTTAYADGKPYIIVWPNGSPDALYHVAA